MTSALLPDATVVNVVCIKWGSKYPSYYVNRLYRGVARHLGREHRFACFTDDPEGIEPGIEVHPLPVEPFESEIVAAMQRRGRKGAWRKISLFRPGLAGMVGPMLGFDLDVTITGGLDELVDHAPDKVCMRREWRYEWQGRQGGHGSVFCFDPARHIYLYEDFARDPGGSVEQHRGSEQYYTSMTAYRRGELAYWPGELIASFKRDAMRLPPMNYLAPPVLPDNCRVMCFHGKPKMEEALAGYAGGVFTHTKPAPWLRRHWVGEDVEH